MAERFNVPPGWPVPAGWTPPEGWEPDPAWPAAPAGWQFWVEDVATPRPGTQQASAAGTRLVVMGAVGAVLLVVLAGAVALFLHNRGNNAALKSSTVTAEVPDEVWKSLPSSAPTVLPPGAVQCGVAQGGTYRAAARGNDVTSCPFAESVRDALNGSGGQLPMSVDAFSSVTGKSYRMSCAMEQVITCRGGNNAVVYVYEQGAIVGAPTHSPPAASAFPSDDAIFDALSQPFAGLPAEDARSRYEIIERLAPTPGWYAVRVHLINGNTQDAVAILRDSDPPDGHLIRVAGPGGYFPGVSVPDEVRRALPAMFSP